jgi:ribosomal protein S4E
MAESVKDTRRGVGVMDVLTLGEEHYRCVLDTNGRLRYRPNLC